MIDSSEHRLGTPYALAEAMAHARLPLFALLLGAAALAEDRPAAVRVCLSLPEGVNLFSATPRQDYRPLTSDTYVLDLELTLDGQVPERLTRVNGNCVQAWLQARPVRSVAVGFERTMLNLAAQEHSVDLKLKPDLWYDGGQLVVGRAPWASVSTKLPGQLTLERLSGPSPRPMTDLEHLPAGRYRAQYEPPAPPTHACATTVRATGIGTVRADNKPALFAEMVEQYRSEILPGVLSSLKMSCTDTEALEVDVRLADGMYVDPIHPAMRKVQLPHEAVRYGWRVDATRLEFENGQTLTLAAGQHAVLEELRRAPPASKPEDGKTPQVPSM